MCWGLDSHRFQKGMVMNPIGFIYPVPIGSNIWYIYLHLSHKNHPNVGNYTNPMDPYGDPKDFLCVMTIP